MIIIIIVKITKQKVRTKKKQFYSKLLVRRRFALAVPRWIISIFDAGAVCRLWRDRHWVLQLPVVAKRWDMEFRDDFLPYWRSNRWWIFGGPESVAWLDNIRWDIGVGWFHSCGWNWLVIFGIGGSRHVGWLLKTNKTQLNIRTHATY